MKPIVFEEKPNPPENRKRDVGGRGDDGSLKKTGINWSKEMEWLLRSASHSIVPRNLSNLLCQDAESSNVQYDLSCESLLSTICFGLRLIFHVVLATLGLLLRVIRKRLVRGAWR